VFNCPGETIELSNVNGEATGLAAVASGDRTLSTGGSRQLRRTIEAVDPVALEGALVDEAAASIEADHAGGVSI
jgi:hypothetical protein